MHRHTGVAIIIWYCTLVCLLSHFVVVFHLPLLFISVRDVYRTKIKMLKKGECLVLICGKLKSWTITRMSGRICECWNRIVHLSLYPFEQRLLYILMHIGCGCRPFHKTERMTVMSAHCERIFPPFKFILCDAIWWKPSTKTDFFAWKSFMSACACFSFVLVLSWWLWNTI